MFCINTDTTVLGEFLNIYRNDTVLDMGTNNGALMIYASFHISIRRPDRSHGKNKIA